MRIAIIIFVYNRPVILAEMLNSLLKCESIAEHDIYFFSDGYKNEKDKENVKKVRDTLKLYLEHKELKDAKVICRNKNLGLAKSVINGVSEIINLYDATICLEDDLVFSHDFLLYMDRALETFKDDIRIWSISGYCQELKCLNKIHANSFLSYRGSSWGWGTWPDRWRTIDWSVRDYSIFTRSIRKRKMFSRGGYDLPFLLDYQMCGLVDSWAIIWCYAQYKENKFTVFPSETRVKHIGCGKESTHVKKDFGKDQVLKLEHEAIETFDAIEDESIFSCFRDYYRINPIKAHIKIVIATKLGIRL